MFCARVDSFRPRDPRVRGDSDFHPFGFVHFMFVSSADHLLPLLIFTVIQLTPCLQTFLIVCCFINVFTFIFINGAQICVASCSTARCDVSCLATNATYCPPATGSFLNRCHLCHLSIPFRPNSDRFSKSISLCLIRCGQLGTRDPRFTGLLLA